MASVSHVMGDAHMTHLPTKGEIMNATLFVRATTIVVLVLSNLVGIRAELDGISRTQCFWIGEK